MPEFNGFPPEALRFYADIERNNERAWFEAHRDDYLTHVITPAKAFIEAVGTRLQSISPGTGFDANHTGRGSFKKIHTDQRFQKGRDPFKTYAQMIFWKGPLASKKSNAVYFVHFDPDKVVLAAGLKYFDAKLVKPYRARVADPVEGARLAKVTGALEGRGYTIEGTHYKGVPRGYDPQHPNAALLKHNALYAQLRCDGVPGAFHGPEFVDWCLAHFEAMEPLFTWSVDFLEHAAA